MSVRRKAIGLIAVSLSLLICLYHTNSPLLKAHSTRPTRPLNRHTLPRYIASGKLQALPQLGLVSSWGNDDPDQKRLFSKDGSSNYEKENGKLSYYSEMTNGHISDYEAEGPRALPDSWDEEGDEEEEEEESYGDEDLASAWPSRYSSSSVDGRMVVGRKMSNLNYPQHEFATAPVKDKDSTHGGKFRNTKRLSNSRVNLEEAGGDDTKDHGSHPDGLQRGNLPRADPSTSGPPEPPPEQANMTAATLHLPDVLIIGAKKAGTRALLEFLRLHPLVSAAKQELHFFDRHYHLGPGWYRRQLPPRRPDQLTVEKTPAYLVSPSVPGRVRHLLPRARLLLVVREPATRALSDYTQGVSKRSAPRSFSDLVFTDRATGLVNVNWGPVAGGLYARHLQRWLRYFPPTSIHVVGGEDLVHSPALEMQKVEKFLGLPPFIKSEHFVFNRTKGFPCIMRRPAPSPAPAPALAPTPARGDVRADTVTSAHDLNRREPQSVQGSLTKSSPISTLLNPLKPTLLNASQPLRPHCLGSTKGRDHPEVDPETFKILQDFYRPFNHKFFRMIGRKFDWNSV